ncbi:MAG: carbohydrate ABC transporter permease, partial [Myxococcales bacterium]
MTAADNDRWLARVLLAPAIIYIFALVGMPFVLALAYSLTSISLGGHSFNFVGLRNFTLALEDPSFRRAIYNTFVFAFASQIVVLVLSSILAIALQKDFHGKWIVRLLILLPWVAP